MDTARGFPKTVSLDGFDIDLGQCPPAPWLPSNVSLKKWDMFTEPPEELVGQFDIVHIRLVTLVIKDNDPRPLLANLRKLLSMLIPRRACLVVSILTE